jgi:type IV pilus assembly protein PilM
MSANTVWGLDIGNSAIKAVKMNKVGNACKIIDFDIVDIAYSEDDKDRPARVQAALADLTTNHKFGNDPVFLAVPGNICLHREFQLPLGSEAKLNELVQYEAKQQISLPLDQVEWGFERYEDPNGIGVALIAVRKNDIQDLLGLAAQFKLNVRGITAGPTALYNFVQYEFNPQTTTLILDAGAKATDFVVMNKRQIYFRTIQIAGREITRVLENKFKVPHQKAEELKKNISQSPQMEKILTVIEPTLRQLGAEVQRTIGFYKSKARGQRIGQCYLLGHTFRLPKMAEYLQAQVREAPFAIVEGLQRVKLDHTCNAEVWNNEFPTMAVAMGLGLQGLGLSDLTLNLVPGETKGEQATARWKGWVAASAAVILATLGYSYVSATKVKEQYEARKKEIEDIELKATAPEKNFLQVVSSIPETEKMLKRYSRPVGLRDRGRINQIVTEITNLKQTDGKPFFGNESQVFLRDVYASRTPVGTGTNGIQGSDRDEKVKNSSNLQGSKSIYGPLATGVDPKSLPPELRPDVPLIVVLTVEFEEKGAFTKLGTLQELLQKLPGEITNLSMGQESQESKSYDEPALCYEWTKPTLFEKATEPLTNEKPEVPKKKYLIFRPTFRWDDKDDRDLPPIEAAAAAPIKK